MKRIGKNLLGDQILGGLDFYRFPQLRQSWGGPFNNQKFRQKMFVELVNKIDFYAIFETGTFRGTTTNFMSATSRSKIYTVEAVERNYGFCRARFWKNRQVRVYWDDSRAFLKKHLQQPQFQNVPIFFYLDAHWHKNLPLFEECEIILSHKIQAVIAIDDFEVIGDREYQFDDYGTGKKLNLDYLEPLTNCTSIFFPNCKATRETGEKRGCVILGTTPNLTQILRKMTTLVEYKQ
jgi:hypothetical protein